LLTCLEHGGRRSEGNAQASQENFRRALLKTSKIKNMTRTAYGFQPDLPAHHELVKPTAKATQKQ
jgi:hypothetical protein